MPSGGTACRPISVPGCPRRWKRRPSSNNQIADKLNEEAKKKIIASGVTKIHELTPAQHAAWVKAMHPVWQKFEGKIGKDIIDAAVASNGPATN